MPDSQHSRQETSVAQQLCAAQIQEFRPETRRVPWIRASELPVSQSHQHQIGVVWLRARRRKHRVYLPSVVGLVVEHM